VGIKFFKMPPTFLFVFPSRSPPGIERFDPVLNFLKVLHRDVEGCEYMMTSAIGFDRRGKWLNGLLDSRKVAAIRGELPLAI